MHRQEVHIIGLEHLHDTEKRHIVLCFLSFGVVWVEMIKLEDMGIARRLEIPFGKLEARRVAFLVARRALFFGGMEWTV